MSIEREASERENVRVCSSSGQMQFVALDAMDKNPVWLDVRPPVAFPRTFQRMVVACLGQRLLIDE